MCIARGKPVDVTTGNWRIRGERGDKPLVGDYFFLRIFPSVLARRARWPVTPFFLANFVNFFAGIFSPALAPAALRSAPGFLIAF